MATGPDSGKVSEYQNMLHQADAALALARQKLVDNDPVAALECVKYAIEKLEVSRGS